MINGFSEQGAVEGPLEFFGGIATGSEHLIGAAVGGVAGAGAKLGGAISQGMAMLTFDRSYADIRDRRQKLTTQTASDIVQSGKSVVKVFSANTFIVTKSSRLSRMLCVAFKT